ncbi:hypothetical protein GCM10007111_44360 [Virgibacillus kapii]|uniref:Uncharacterized protein n=1 Tax=Virgibacillus kapii TaxID=1638645 RepID=A0ABQ2E0V6_9BACI|nr:hypothetical protein GCM10007111_44360 [Virgibacillus kapii]
MPTSSRSPFMGDGVPFVEWTGELRSYARLSGRHGAAAKASLNRANEYAVVDPKPCDLPMSRVKVR